MTGTLDGHNLELSSTPLDRLEEAVATAGALQTHINDNIDPHGSLLRQSVLAINDEVRVMADTTGINLVAFSDANVLKSLKLQNVDARGTLRVGDSYITLSTQASSPPTDDAGMKVYRGSAVTTKLVWDESNDIWTLVDDTGNSFRILDQRDRDELDLRDDTIENDLHTNYVHKTGSVAEPITGDKTFTDDIIISGNLTVNGDTTYVNTEQLNVSDNIINLNNDVTGTPTENAGISIIRGTSSNMALLWNESSDTWTLTDDGSNYHKIADQRDVDTINAYITNNYVHRTGSVAESISGAKTFTSATVFNNNLTVNGGLTTINSQLNITDNVVTLNSDVSGTPTENAGIQIERGSSSNVAILWNEASDYWSISNDGSNYFRIITTDDEGPGNNFDADTVDTYHASIASEANKIVVRNSSGNVYLGTRTYYEDGTSLVSSGETLYYRNIAGSWDKVWHSGNDGAGSGLDADLLDGRNLETSAAANSVAQRTSDGDIYARLFRSTHATQTTAPSTSADILFRNDNGSDNYHRAMSNTAFSTWCQNAHIKTYDSERLHGMLAHMSRNDEANKIVRTDSSGYLQTGWINTTSGQSTTQTITRVYASHDAYLRYYSLADFATQVLSQGSTVNAHTHTFLRVADTRNANTPPSGYSFKLQGDFKSRSTVNNPGTTGTYCGVMTFAPYSDSSGGNAYQMAFTQENGLALRTGGLGASSWGSWAKLWHSANDGHNSGLDADKLDGRHAAVAATASTMVERNSSGEVYATAYISGSSGTVLKTDYGSVQIGPANSSYCHYQTSAPSHYFNKELTAVNKLSVYSSNTYLTSTEGKINNHIIWHSGNDGSGSGLDADLLDGRNLETSAVANSVTQRTSSGDIYARLFRSTYATQTTAPASSADILFRNDNGSDNYHRAMSNTAFSAWCQAASIKTADSNKLGGHTSSYYEPAFTKNTAFNKNFGTGHSDVARGDHTHGATDKVTSVSSSWASVSAGGYKYISHPAGVPQSASSYRVSVTPTSNTNGDLGDIRVVKYSSNIRVYRTGSTTAHFDVIYTWE